MPDYALGLLLVVFLTHIVGGMAAFGSALLSVAVIVMIWGGDELGLAVSLLALCGLCQALTIAWTMRRHLDRKELLAVALWALPGLVAGHFLAPLLPEQAIRLLLGALLCLGGLLHWLPLPKIFAWRPVAALTTTAGGIVHGAFATGGALLIPLLRERITERDAFRATMSCTWVVLNCGLVALRSGDGSLFTVPPALLAAGVAIALIATVLGQRLVTRVDRVHFAHGCSALMVVCGMLSLVLSR